MSVFDHFVGLQLKGLMISDMFIKFLMIISKHSSTIMFNGSKITMRTFAFNPLRAYPTKWLNILKLSVFDHFVKLALKGLMKCRFKAIVKW